MVESDDLHAVAGAGRSHARPGNGIVDVHTESDVDLASALDGAGAVSKHVEGQRGSVEDDAPDACPPHVRGLLQFDARNDSLMVRVEARCVRDGDIEVLGSRLAASSLNVQHVANDAAQARWPEAWAELPPSEPIDS
jgi:hypothetical protein